jgi:hypothetical protein
MKASAQILIETTDQHEYQSRLAHLKTEAKFKAKETSCCCMTLQKLLSVIGR